MSLEILYQWQNQIASHFPELGVWQSLNLALYSLGMVLARHNGATRVAEALGMVGKPESMRRRQERFLDNPRLDSQKHGQLWARWILSQLGTNQPALLVDETKLGKHLRGMVVGIAYHSCCIPLAFWAYLQMPLPQVELIETLLGWVELALPAGSQPLLQADRGIGASPDLIRTVEGLGWHYLFRVQNDTHSRTQAGHSRPLKQLV